MTEIAKQFFSREDIAAVKFKERIFPILIDNLDKLIEGHFKGKDISFVERNPNGLILHYGLPRLGSYTLNVDNKCAYLCIDCDEGEQHATSLQSACDVARRLYLIFKELGLFPYIERSFSGKGYHIWLFFDEKLDASIIRDLAFKIIPRDIKLSNGSFIDIYSGKGLEIFPKQDKLIKGGIGNFVFLPLFYGAKDGCNIFLDEEFNKFSPKEFQLTLKSKVEELCNKLVTPDSKKNVYSISLDSSNTIWEIWRRKVLESLDLELVYGKYLTGKDNGDWLECRDPWAEKGDKKPSAGVSKGGTIEKGVFHSFISAENLSIFDFIRKLNLVEDNHLEACKYIASISGLDIPNTYLSISLPELETEETQFVRDDILTNNRQFRDILNDAWRGVVNSNEGCPKIFKKSTTLVKVVNNNLHVLMEPDVYNYISQVSNWIKIVNGTMFNVPPLDKIARDITICDHPEKCNLPELDCVVNTPVFTRTKELIVTNGYNESGRVWLSLSNDLQIGEIPISPSQTDIILAKELIENEMLCDFPFLSVSDLCHTYAALFMPFVRQLIDGPTPLHVVEAPGPGTGKGKLCNLISIISTGNSCDGRSIPNSDEEIRKMATAELMKAKPIILLDNASEKKKLDSPSLCSILTSTTWTDRLLGFSQMVNATNYALWLLTANNPHFSMEIARRCIRIRLDSKTDQPWRRSKFKHEYVEEWAKKNRSILVKAILILVQNWITKGTPLEEKRLGSFESWSAIIGGILNVNEIGGFLGNMEELYESSDTEGNEWRQFIIKWFQEHGNNKVNINSLVELCDKYTLMEAFLQNTNNIKLKINKLKDLLRIANERTIANFRLKYKNNEFYLETLNNASSEEKRKERGISTRENKQSCGTSV